MSNVFLKPSIPSIATIDENVVKQLEHRAELYSKKFDQPHFTQQFLNANNAWVRVVSGVELDQIPDAWKGFILQGGTLDKEGAKLRAGFNTTQPFDESPSQFYNFEKNEGLVPSPGITSFQVVNKGSGGWSRKVSLTIKCYSREQLAIMEQLYMRPGFPVFVEWGHSIYRDAGGDPVFDPKLNTVVLEGKPSPNKLKEQSADLIVKSGYNYDYLNGVVFNYNWKYEPGYYELLVDIMGEGDASAIVKTVFGTGGKKPSENQEGVGIEFDEKIRATNPLSGIFKAISNATKPKFEKDKFKPYLITEDSLNKAVKPFKSDIDKIVEGIGDGYKLEAYCLPVTSKALEIEFVYVKLKFLIGLINYYFIPKLNGDTAPTGKFTTDKDRCLYVTYPDHFSADISTCLLPQQTGVVGIDTKDLPGKREEDKGDILDIYVNTSTVQQLYDEMKESSSDTEKFTIDAFLSNLLSKMQVSLGGVNDFQLHNDYYLKNELGPSSIVDMEALPAPENTNKANYTLPVAGKNSMVSSFSINSQLSKNMIDYIAAQAIITGQSAARGVGNAMSRFNSGIKKRFVETVDDSAAGDDVTAEKTYSETLEEYKKIWTDMMSKGSIDEDTFNAMTEEASYYIQYELATHIANKGVDGSKKGHVGANLSIELLGIGGLKVLEFFNIPSELLPYSYQEAGVAFQIINLSHDIQNGKWITKIEARAIILGK